MRMINTLLVMMALVLSAVPSMAYENNMFKVQTVDYSYVDNAGSAPQPSQGKDFELNLSSSIINNPRQERINMASERKQRNMDLYKYTEKPSDYMHAVQQGYVPW